MGAGLFQCSLKLFEIFVAPALKPFDREIPVAVKDLYELIAGSVIPVVPAKDLCERGSERAKGLISQ